MRGTKRRCCCWRSLLALTCLCQPFHHSSHVLNAAHTGLFVARIVDSLSLFVTMKSNSLIIPLTLIIVARTNTHKIHRIGSNSSSGRLTNVCMTNQHDDESQLGFFILWLQRRSLDKCRSHTIATTYAFKGTKES